MSEGGRPLLKLRFPARPSRLRGIRQRVHAVALACGGCEAFARDLVIAVDEACQNIIRHAYSGREGDIVLELRCDGDRVIVRLTDFAPEADKAKIKPRCLDDLRPGGLGTHFMREIMDDIAFLPPPLGAGNLLQMTKRIV